VVGFAVHRGVVDGLGLCRMFNRAIHTQALPKYLNSDHGPLYLFHQWQANLRVLDIQEIKTVLYAPLSHPFVESLPSPEAAYEVAIQFGGTYLGLNL
jgi:hypothetical protein